ncbi:hypothetical protein L1887_22746 [Cichorium endivia]|nr:hypothetical protein L1887_22746 [Cichorium endivia]
MGLSVTRLQATAGDGWKRLEEGGAVPEVDVQTWEINGEYEVYVAYSLISRALGQCSGQDLDGLFYLGLFMLGHVVG